MLESTVGRRSANTDARAEGSSRWTCSRCRITLRSGMRPFLMSWLIWRARSPTVARLSASRTRAVLVRSRDTRSPSSRDREPTSSVRPWSKRTSRRSRSSTAVFWARAASGLLIRDDCHRANSRAVTPVPTAVIRNQESTRRCRIRSGASD